MTTRDNLALCAMQVMLKHEWKTRISLYNRVRRFFGLSYTTSCDKAHPFSGLMIAGYKQ